jgi:hypothetical protein
MDVMKLQKGSLRIHTLLWLNDSLDTNTLVQTLLDDEFFNKI